MTLIFFSKINFLRVLAGAAFGRFICHLRAKALSLKTSDLRPVRERTTKRIRSFRGTKWT